MKVGKLHALLRLTEMASYNAYASIKLQQGIFADLLAEQNRYSAEKAGEKSILHSAFPGALAPQQWAQSATMAAPDGAVAPSYVAAMEISLVGNHSHRYRKTR